MASRFLFNQSLWAELEERVHNAKRTRAAVAYLGAGATKLLPLKKGDSLVVDLSLSSVRAGTTDPREVRKYVRRGVVVFSRGTLHAKFFVLDDALIAGSANISKNAYGTLDEAAIVTTDNRAVARARANFDALCTEPVRKEYLDKCIAEYRPPTRPRGVKARHTPRTRQAKLWLIAGLKYLNVSDAEEEAIQKVTARIALSDFDAVEVHWIRYPSRQKFMTQLRAGDWIVACTKTDRGYDVAPPSRFLGVETYKSSKGKARFLLLSERPVDAEDVRWTEFRQRMAVIVPALKRPRPRTVPIADDAQADAILGQWTARGAFRKRRA